MIKSQNKSIKHVLIIGAGPAGLTTAYWLLKNAMPGQKYDVTILEASDHVGGISSTIKFGDGYLVDTGIHRYFSKSKIVNDLWQELLPLQAKPAYDDLLLGRQYHYPTTGSDPERQEKSLLIKKRVTRIYTDGNFFDYPVSLNLTTLRNLGFKKLVRVAWTYMLACIHKLPETSLENFYINCFGRELYDTFFKNYTTKVWGLTPVELSADWGSQRVKGISVGEVLKDAIRSFFHRKNAVNTQTSLVDEFVYPKLGAGQMWQVMAKEIEKMGGRIILQTQVKQFLCHKNNHKIDGIVCRDHQGQKRVYPADIVVSSMPIAQLVAGIGREHIDEQVYRWATSLPYRDFIDVYLVTDKLKLKNTTTVKTVANIIPDDWIYLQDKNTIAGRAQIFNNWSPYLFPDKKDIDKKFLISLEYFASVGDQLWQKSDEQMCALAIAEAVRLGLIERPEDVTAYHSHKIYKAYPAYFGSYDHIQEIQKQLDTFVNLYCVGRNGQHRYNNMDHSMLTGIEAANLILAESNDRQRLWHVNTEKEYHESGKAVR